MKLVYFSCLLMLITLTCCTGLGEKEHVFIDANTGLTVSSSVYPSDWEVISRPTYTMDQKIPVFLIQIQGPDNLKAFNTPLKKANEKHNPDLFFTTWTEVVAQENVGLDSTLGNVMMLELIKMAKKLPERHEKWTAMIIDCLEDIRLKLSLNPDSSSWYVAGLRLAMRYSEIYSNFDKFVEWWGPENLAPKDYRPYRAADGTEIMPLAERLWLAWGEHLLKQEDLTNDQIDSFLERIRQVSRAHHDYTWLDYIEAKMLLQADRAPEALPILRKFLTQKPREWWAWSALGQIAFQQNDYEKAIACYGMALSLQEDENELTETREELAKIWLISGEPEMAKRELTLAIHAYSRANKEIPEILLEMANMEAISSVDAASENEVGVVFFIGFFQLAIRRPYRHGMVFYFLKKLSSG